LLKRLILTALFFVSLSRPSQAAPDFYGVRMKSEDFAQDTFLIENNKIPDFSNNRPGTDKRIYAYGYMGSSVGGGRGFSIKVFNHSDRTLNTEKLFRELVLVAYNGRRYDRSQTEMMWSRDRMGPGEEATFNFKFPGIRLEKEEIRMAVCSFDMSDVSIYLFPLKEPEKPAPIVKKSEPPKKIPKPKPAEKVLSKKEEPKEEPAAPQHLTPIRVVQSFFRGVGERISGKNKPAEPSPSEIEGPVIEEAADETPVVEDKRTADNKRTPDYPLVKPDQVIEGAHYHFSPEFRKDVHESQKQVEGAVYRDRPWSLDAPDGLFTHNEAASRMPEMPRREAKVVLVNPEYGFVVLDAGFESGFGKNIILDVMRSGRRIGKVMITKPRDKISGAVILPEWRTREEIRSGDMVGMSR